jgi:hypothetical protein
MQCLCLFAAAFAAGLVVGKLDQRQSCLQVHDVASRDVRPADTRGLADALGNWCVCIMVNDHVCAFGA